MFDKGYLRKKFAAENEKFYTVKLFEDEGFQRKVCVHCGKGFWTASGGESCGDSSHTPYSFIRQQPRSETYPEFWKKFEEFWKKRGHESVPRYPVLSRWRDDLYFTIASIVDFQRLEGGKTVFEYPANPLVVPQMCLRFNDIANVGVTGRHFSCFMMAGQHAFDCDKQAYWKDDCIRYNYEFLREVLEIPKEEITYGEDVWSIPDYSSFGPCIESFARGSELVNSVFTEFRRVPGTDGFEPLDMKVIDVGWGFERLLWYRNGNASAYDAVFPSEMAFIKSKASFEFDARLMEKYSSLAAGLDVETTVNMRQEREKIARQLGITPEEMTAKIAPMQAAYAIADHSRALLFAICDGALPSNAAGGYNLRVLARRAFSFISENSFNLSLDEVMEMQANALREMFPELPECVEDCKKILDEEKRKYKESYAKASRAAAQVLAKGTVVTADEMAKMYESNGVTPEILEEAGRKAGKRVEVPSEFYRKLTEKHVMDSKKESANEWQGVPATRATYYEQPELREANVKVLAVKESLAVLDETIFYPAGGGQEEDLGTVGGIPVVEVRKSSGVITHRLAQPPQFKPGEIVRLVIDWPRRQSVMRHHTSTHLLIQSCRRVLGRHVWQCGSNKGEDEAHVDITHYRKPSAEEVKAIEEMANEKVAEAIPVKATQMDRGEAERKYGFRLYQGGGAIGKTIRVIEIENFDVQACGGLHLSNTQQVGLLKITGVESIQDGVVRLRYRAGVKALEWMNEREALLQKTAETLSVQPEQTPQATARIFEEWKQRGKQLETLEEQLAEVQAEKLATQTPADGVVKAEGLLLQQKLVEKLVLQAAALNPAACFLATSNDGFAACACGKDSAKNAAEVLKASGAKGGGTKEFARGKNA